MNVQEATFFQCCILVCRHYWQPVQYLSVAALSVATLYIPLLSQVCRRVFILVSPTRYLQNC